MTKNDWFIILLLMLPRLSQKSHEISAKHICKTYNFKMLTSRILHQIPGNQTSKFVRHKYAFKEKGK